MPLTGSDSISDFVARYEKLQSVKIVVLRRNKDVDPAETMEELDQLAQLVGAPNATLAVVNGGGLIAEGVTKLVQDVTSSGNQTVTLKGVDEDGVPLSGSNEDFSIKPIINHVPPGTRARARFLVGKLGELLAKGIIKAPAGHPDARAKAVGLIDPQ